MVTALAIAGSAIVALIYLAILVVAVKSKVSGKQKRPELVRPSAAAGVAEPS